MKRSRYSEEQVAYGLRRAEAGTAVGDVCRQLGISEATFGAFQIAIRRACGLAQLSRTAWYRPRRAKDQTALRLRIRELAHARPRFGYLRIWVLLRREGWLRESEAGTSALPARRLAAPVRVRP